MPTEPISVIVTSRNPVKLRSTERAFRTMFPDVELAF